MLTIAGFSSSKCTITLKILKIHLEKYIKTAESSIPQSWLHIKKLMPHTQDGPFEDTQNMEPTDSASVMRSLQRLPTERSKRECFICGERKRPKIPNHTMMVALEDVRS